MPIHPRLPEPPRLPMQVTARLDDGTVRTWTDRYAHTFDAYDHAINTLPTLARVQVEVLHDEEIRHAA